MLLETLNQNEQISFPSNDQRLELKIHELVSLYSSKDKVCRPYSFAQLDSEVGIEVNLIFSYKQVSVIGLLKYTNGQPVRIPEVYCDFLVKKLQKCLEGRIKFSMISEISLLKLQSDTKFEITSSDPFNFVISFVKSVIADFPLIYSQLLAFGFGKKTQKESLKLIKEKLIFLRNVSTILNSEENKNTTTKSSESFYDQNKEGSVFRFYDKVEPFKITQTHSKDSSTESESENLVREGGFSQVEKKKCQISEVFVSSTETKKITTDLAIKTMRINQKNKFSISERIRKEYRALNKIQDPQHTLNYWIKLAHPSGKIEDIFTKWDDMDQIYIQYEEETMDDFIYCNQSKSIQNIVEYSKQIINGVQILHNSGVVHRDLKPDNLLLAVLPDNKKCIKIIDFSESVLTESAYDENISHTLGSTMPYSPIECYMATKESFNSSEIDLWSVGIILIELLMGKNPITYSKCFGMDIYKGWKIPNEFGVFCPARAMRGMRLIEFIFGIIAVKSVCVEQQERMPLKKMEKIILEISKFMNKIEEI